MKSIFTNLIQEVLSEMFVDSINLKEIQSEANITILFKDNNIQLKKVKDKFKVLKASNPERVKVGDIIEFLESDIKIGTSPKCYIYRRNEIKKFKKINMVHQFSDVTSIDLI